MAELTASRTLVKSSPELWAECSDAASLARHLGAFGEIHITKLEPETAVAWEGEAVRGTVTLEPSGWGTRVVLTASTAEVRAATEPEAPADARAPAEPEVPAGARAPAEPAAPVAHEEPEASLASTAGPGRPRGRLSRFFAFWRRSPEQPVQTVAPAEPDTDSEPSTETPGPPDPGSVALVEALDSLGQAHRRPFSHG